MNKSATIIIDIKQNILETQISSNTYVSNEVRAKIISGLAMRWTHFLLRLSLLKIIISVYPNPGDWFLALKYLIQLRKKFMGKFTLKKMAVVDGKYYMGLYTPGWNDLNYRKFIVSELNHFKPVNDAVLRFNHVYVAITKKCALQCDHCYAWDVLNQKDQLSNEDLRLIVNKLQSMGTGQIHLTGGEPLIKPDLLMRILKSADKTSNFWINTSGFKLTNEVAKRLKEVGLTGVFISLDHFEADIHNDFRKFKDAYYWAITGAQNAINNKLVVALSLCVRNEFVYDENLMAYMKLAKKLGVQFVQFLEPKEVGHYSGKSVAINQEKINLLESFYIKMNFSDDFLDFPIISYHGYYQRRQGCYAGGNRSMYIDTDGNLNACPFCQTNNGNILDHSLENNLATMSKQGCPTF